MQATERHPNVNPEQPLVSIIVPTFNRARFLERCVRSILDQSYPNIECWVMDAASKDGSLEILQRLGAADNRLKFVSEPDEGEVDATNKGLRLATGEIIGVQASDDFYVPDAVESAVEFLVAHPGFGGVSGDGVYVNDQGSEIGRGVITYRGEMAKANIRHILMVRYKSCFVLHGSFFGWRERVERIGGLDPAFSFIPDWEFYLRLLEAGERIGCLPRVQYKFTIHSDMGSHKYFHKAEAQRVLLHNRCGMRWYHELFRSTVGRAISYLANPYRTPFVAGLRREIGESVARHFGR